MQPTTRVTADLLARLPLFSALASTQLDVIAAGCHRVAVHRDEILFHQGDPVRGFFVVLRGQIELTVSAADGSEKVVEIVAAGESLGEAVVVDGQRYPVTSTALVPSDLLAVSSAAVLDLLDRDPAFARKLLANMAVRLRQLIRDVQSYTLHSGVQRVVGFLLHEASDDARESVVVLPTSKRVMASRLNLAPETLSRVLRDLAAEGLISVSGRRVTLHDVPRLESCLQWRGPQS